MKTRCILIGTLMAVCVNVHAQVKVFPNNHVGVTTNLTSPNAKLVVGNHDRTSSSYDARLISSPSTYAICNVGVEGWAASDTAMTTGRSIGVRGIAGNCRTGNNYGVMGVLDGERYGTGIYGTVNETNDLAVPGFFAGYFDGDVRVHEMLIATIVNRFNRLDATTQEYDEPTDQLLAMITPCKRRASNLIQISDSTNHGGGIIDPFPFDPGKGVNSNPGYDTYTDHLALNSSYLSVLAAAFPGLVVEDSGGNLRFNYVEVIPILVAAIRDLAGEVGISLESLRSYDILQELTESRSLLLPRENACIDHSGTNENIVLNFTLPKDTEKASLLLFDKTGRLISQNDLAPNAKYFELDKAAFPTGTFIYTLLADGKEVATKRVVVSDGEHNKQPK